MGWDCQHISLPKSYKKMDISRDEYKLIEELAERLYCEKHILDCDCPSLGMKVAYLLKELEQTEPFKR